MFMDAEMSQKKLIVISGCSGGGKSTIINAFADHGYTVMPEAGRQIVQEQMEQRGNLLPWSDAVGFTHGLIERNIRFYNQALDIEKPKNNIIFFDRSLLDALCYLKFQNQFSERHRQMIDQYRYNTVVFMLPAWPEIYIQDSERQHGFDVAIGEYNRLIEFYPKYGYQVIEVPKLSVAKRLKFIMDPC